MYRIASNFVFILSLGILISCSGTSQTTQNLDSEANIKQYPSWYPDKKVVSSDAKLSAYATAIGEDSDSAVSKAVNWATSELKSSVSNKLENIRSEAIVEYGSDSGLDSPRFLIALRKVDEAVDPLVQTGRTEVKTVEGYSSYLSFAEVTVPKDELIERIGKRLAGYDKAWKTMKDSKAFKTF